MPDESGPERVVFHATDLSAAADLVRRSSTLGDDIGNWVDVRPLDLPAEALPETKGMLGRTKKAEPPSFQIIYVEQAVGDEEHTLNIDARSMSPLEAATAAGIAIPAGWKVEGDKHGVLAYIPSSVSAEEVLGFAVGTIRAVLNGWDGQFEAVEGG